MFVVSVCVCVFYTRFSSASIFFVCFFVSVQNISTSVHNKSWKIHYSPSGFIKFPSVLFPKFSTDTRSFLFLSNMVTDLILHESLFFLFIVCFPPLSAPQLYSVRIFLFVLVLSVSMGVLAVL